MNMWWGYRSSKDRPGSLPGGWPRSPLPLEAAVPTKIHHGGRQVVIGVIAVSVLIDQNVPVAPGEEVPAGAKSDPALGRTNKGPVRSRSAQMLIALDQIQEIPLRRPGAPGGSQTPSSRLVGVQAAAPPIRIVDPVPAAMSARCSIACLFDRRVGGARCQKALYSTTPACPGQIKQIPLHDLGPSRPGRGAADDGRHLHPPGPAPPETIFPPRRPRRRSLQFFILRLPCYGMRQPSRDGSP